MEGPDIIHDFTGRVGGDIANLNRYFLDSFTDTNDNIRAEAWEGRWQGEGTSNFYPAVNGSQGSSYFNKRFSTFLLEDGSFFRLKNLTLAYQFSLKNYDGYVVYVYSVPLPMSLQSLIIAVTIRKSALLRALCHLMLTMLLILLAVRILWV